MIRKIYFVLFPQEYHPTLNVTWIQMFSIKWTCLSQHQASAGVTVRVMVTLLIFLSLLGLQESWQEIRILKLVDVLEDPFLIQEIEVHLLNHYTSIFVSLLQSTQFKDHDQVSSAKRSLASVSRNWRSSFKRIQTPYILPKSRARSVRNRFLFMFVWMSL